jgi:phosphinothricin acetyltransferase
MEQAYTCRSMIKEDWPAVLEIYRQGLETNLATFETECPTYEDFDKGHLQFCRFVAVSGSEIMGWVVLSPISFRKAYRGVAEVSIYIAGKFRNKGVGKTLLNLVVEESGKQGIWTLQSGILASNAASLALHTQCGFRLVGYREKIARDRFGIWQDTCLMEKRRPVLEACGERQKTTGP